MLIYHRVGGGSDSAVDLPIDTFAAQLEYLTAHHRVVSLDDAVGLLAGSQPDGWIASHQTSAMPDEHLVAITFDDGTADFAEHAAPLLVEHGLPATLFVTTQYIDHGVDFPWGAPPTSWNALADACSTGLIHIGNHSHSHALFDRIDVAAARAEIERSAGLITERLGVDAPHFAYPKAIPPSPHNEIEVRRRFASASLAGNRVNRFGASDLHRIARTPIRRDDDLATFARHCRGGSMLEGALRDGLASVRYRARTT